MFDPEIEAIAKCHDLFKVLEDDSKIRVIQWLISKFELNPQPHWIKGNASIPTETAPVAVIPAAIQNNPPEPQAVEIIQEKTIEGFETVAEFFADISPKHDPEKALVVATYFQLKNGLSDWGSQEVNKELKNLGHASSNITGAITACMEKKPQLIIQLRKEGNSQQARKKYKVSGEGIKYVKSMLQKAGNEG